MHSNDWRKLKAAHDAHFVEGPSLPTDEWHEYLARRARHVFLDPDALHSFYSLEGRNVSDEATAWFPLTVAGDSQADIEEMQVEVYNRLAPSRGRPWRAQRRDLLHDDPYVKTVRISFERPLPPGGEFRYDIHLRWPGTATTEEDYLFGSLRTYPRGVEQSQLAVVLPSTPTHVRTGYLSAEGSFHLLDEGLLELDYERAEVRWTISRPSLDCAYALRFRRTDRAFLGADEARRAEIEQ